MTRELFDTKKSEKYKNCKIKFTKTIPSVASICRNIVKLGFDKKSGTDNIIRLYDITSIVMHRGYGVERVYYVVSLLHSPLCLGTLLF